MKGELAVMLEANPREEGGHAEGVEALRDGRAAPPCGDEAPYMVSGGSWVRGACGRAITQRSDGSRARCSRWCRRRSEFWSSSALHLWKPMIAPERHERSSSSASARTYTPV